MKIACPHCQVKGKTEDKFIGTMLLCPKCEGTFMVGKTANRTSTPPKEAETPKNESMADVVPPTTCSKCGLTFSEESLTIKDNMRLCEICSFLSSQEREDLASKVDDIFSKSYFT